MNSEPVTINEALVSRLIASQFPQWQDLPVRPVAHDGWDNRTFHMGEHMLVRMPSAAEYAAKVEIEHHWLPQLAPLLPLAIPVPLAMGEPGEGYPWRWSVYTYLEGDDLSHAPNVDLCEVAGSLARFLTAFQSIDTTGAPAPGPHNFYRGGPLATYDEEIRQAIAVLKDTIDVDVAIQLWEDALATTWPHAPVWLHGDMAAGNLLAYKGKLSAVIDFGGMAVGDPACDLAIAWTLFEGKSRKLFRELLPLDAGTWARGRAWVLWKALCIVAGLPGFDTTQVERARQILDDVLGPTAH